MVVSDASIHNIMGGMESTAGVRLHNHRRKLKQRFDIIKKLGQGTYGKVQLGINKETGQEVAIKTIKKAKIETEADLVRIRREIQIMSSVQHPNIIHIYEVFENREKMVLVMEYAAGGELYDFLSEKKVLAEEEARRIFRQIATAVYYCHKHKICHRDLKLENILLDEHGSAKIADFGLSNVFNEQRLLNTFCGSPLYASPEIVKGTPYHGPEVDCWSLGVLLYTLVYGAMPFDGSNFKRLVKQISQGDYFEPKKPSPASPLIREMLTVTPARRANIEKICAHWWVNEGHTESCLDIAEELANQTPVRLDLLLSLAPPPPAVGSDMLLTDEQGGGDSQGVSSDALGPARCHSVGSIMELDQPAAERKLKEFERQKQRGSIGDGTPVIKDAPKRKLEEGASCEDVVHSGVKKKESCRRQDNEPSTSKSSPIKTSNKSSPSISTEEKMDVDVDVSEPALSETTPVGNNREIAKNVTEVTEGASAITDAGTSQAIAEKPAEKESNKTTISRDKTTRKSLKGSAKKSKPASITSADNIPASNSVLSNKDMESKNKDKEEEEVTKVVENGTEGSAVLPAEVSSEVNKEKEGVDATVKQKVKKKKKITSSKTDELIIESSQNKADNVPCDSSLELNDSKSKAEDRSSQDSKKELKNEEATETEAKEVSEITNNVVPAAKDVTSNKTTEPSKIGSVRTKKPPGDLSLSSEKSSGSEDVTSPTKTVERRRSKIFENSEQFNIFLRGSDSKSAVVDKPKKVFIPGVKVSDYKQAFERRSSLTTPSSAPIKNSASKKSIEQNSANIDSNISDELKSQETLEPLLKSAEKSEISVKSKEQISTSVDTAPSKQIIKDENSSINSVETNVSISKSEVNKEVVNDKTKPAELPKTLKDDESDLKLVPALQVTDKMSQQEKARIKKLKDAVDVISNAIAEETKRESGDLTPVRKISSTKPPVPGLTEKSKIKSAVNTISSTKSPPTTPSEKKTVHTQLPTDVKSNVPENVEKSVPGGRSTGEAVQKETDSVAAKQVEFDSDKNVPAKKKSSKVEITLKSATLPRRRTSKAEIQLGFPPSKPVDAVAAGEYRTEVEHMVGNDLPSRLQTQRSEVAFPVAAAKNVHPISIRSSSLEPEGTPKVKSKPREHIIPIQVEQERDESIRPPAAKPPVPPLQQQRSLSQRSSSLSRQSTQDSDTDSTISVSGPEPIRKSPREYIIPIAVEGGGYVTPRAGSLEPSVSEASTDTLRSSGRTNKLKKMGSLLSDSDDEGFNSPYVTLQRHSSVGREGDNLDDDRPFHRMHKLRSSKPRRATLEHNDSLSSAEEEDDDDDDGFEILTAESLFSTLLSRVRSLTQRLNVEDGGRTGFPSSRLMSHLATSGHSSPSSGFWSNVYGFPADPLSRRVSESSQYGRPYGEGPTPWRRSVSRENSEVDSVYSEGDGGTLPRASVRVTVHVPRGGLGRGRGWVGGAGTSTTATTNTTLLQPQQKATTTATY